MLQMGSNHPDLWLESGSFKILDKQNYRYNVSDGTSM